MTVKTIKPNLKRFEPIKIIEPFNSDEICFENVDDFTAYYRTHEDEFKDKSTVLLNKKYKIPGYRITQNRESHELSLRKDYYGSSKGNSAAFHDVNENDFEGRITKIENSIIELKTELNNIIKYLESN